LSFITAKFVLFEEAAEFMCVILMNLIFQKVISTFVRNSYEKSQYTAHTSSEPVTYLGICGVGGRLLTKTFDMMFRDGPEWIINYFVQRSFTM
jgi:hypothetical protein